MLIAISAPARSIEAQATSISRLRITSRIGMSSTSTSYIDFSTVSGSMPWLMVRLPCGSMSIASTRWPASAKATARFRVVVVFATPPFWLANAITFNASRNWLGGLLLLTGVDVRRGRSCRAHAVTPFLNGGLGGDGERLARGRRRRLRRRRVGLTLRLRVGTLALPLATELILGSRESLE